ncbi:hypothetical protein CORC01_07958 [Colletotrichum orchidophilum]|uniref:Uncharacterized protein n=1 Tax=Colletotrichum orchidophilum TaxID=1209926 RepID=A0A1G4B694_9PEZI|nr:uncharacterized protein CORC01_07958 [Colletotrichum orchidophilum]OHE96812.1 hypothetical protein CORC01_07958 [Colletotrichum orchidophilum]
MSIGESRTVSACRYWPPRRSFCCLWRSSSTPQTLTTTILSSRGHWGVHCHPTSPVVCSIEPVIRL